MADVLAKIEEGTKLHAIYAADGDYYVAKVVSVSTSKSREKKPVKVEYIGYDEQAWLPLSDLKSKKLGLKPKVQAEAKAKAKGKAKAKEPPTPDYSDFKKGLKIQVKAADDGKFYPAQVVQVSTKGSDAPIKINWVGYTSASDEWVGADRIKSKALKFKSAKPKILGPLKNAAFVFIKPHAVTEKVKELVEAGLKEKSIKILKKGFIKGEVIDKKKLIDQHYYAIASKATILKPDQLNVPEDKFKAQFGLEWKEALASGKVFNAMDGCEELGLDADGLDAEWAKAKAAKKLVKFGGGFYCGLIESGGKALYIFNGFFMSMRSKFTKPGTQIHYYSVEWDPKTLSWEDFRGKVLGPTDPSEAPKDSLRGEVLAKWKDLGLEAEPNVGDNAVHASASPFEAFAERNNWLKVPPGRDMFGRTMLSEGVPLETITAWSVDPQVNVGDGKMGSIFDALEDMNVDDCLAKVVQLSKVQ